MAELFEYSLAIIASVLLSGASVEVYSSYTDTVRGLQFKSTFNSVLGLATQSLDNGSSRATIDFQASTLSCSGGVLSLTSASESASASVNDSCSFSYQIVPGPHTLAFTGEPSGLTVRVG